MQAGMSIDQDMLALLGDLRAAGRPVALVSNSFGPEPTAASTSPLLPMRS
jgi:hypothetical protein